MGIKRMDEEDILFHSIRKDTEHNKSILKLVMLEDDNSRLKDILLGLHIRSEKQLIRELRAFIEDDAGLTDDAKQDYKNALQENEEIYKEIEKTIADKLDYSIEEIEEFEEIEGEDIKYEGVRDTVSNFRYSSDEIKLTTYLDTIITTQGILQEEFQGITVTEENAEEVLGIMNNVIDISVKWLEYLDKQSQSGGFDLTQKKFWELMDATIVESKKTLEIAKVRRQQIAEEFPDIAKKVDEKDEAGRDSDGEER